MPRTMDVYLERDLVGRLVQDENGQLAFYYAGVWLNNAKAVPLSHSLPLRNEKFSRNECRGFFAGVLPDESKREIIATNLAAPKMILPCLSGWVASAPGRLRSSRPVKNCWTAITPTAR